VKKFAGQGAAGVVHQQMVDGAPAAPEAGQSALGYDALKGVDAAGNDFGDFLK